MKLFTSLLALTVFFCFSVIPQRCFGIIETTTAQIAEKTIASKQVALIKLSTSWCPSCIAMKDIDTAIGKYFNKKNEFKFLIIDGETPSNKSFLEKYTVKGYPTYLLFKRGNVIDRLIGTQTKETLIAAINNALTM